MDLVQKTQRVRDMLADIISVELSVPRAKVRDNSTFDSDLRIDSLDLVELAMTVEEAFDVHVPEEAFETIRKVGDLVEYVTQKWVPPVEAAEEDRSRVSEAIREVQSQPDNVRTQIALIADGDRLAPHLKRLELSAEGLKHLLERTLGGAWVEHVTVQPGEAGKIYLMLLTRQALLFYVLEARKVRFHFAPLSDLVVVTDCHYGSEGRIQAIDVIVQASIVDVGKALRFNFVGNDIDGTLEFLRKYAEFARRT